MEEPTCSSNSAPERFSPVSWDASKKAPQSTPSTTVRVSTPRSQRCSQRVEIYLRFANRGHVADDDRCWAWTAPRRCRPGRGGLRSSPPLLRQTAKGGRTPTTQVYQQSGRRRATERKDVLPPPKPADRLLRYLIEPVICRNRLGE